MKYILALLMITLTVHASSVVFVDNDTDKLVIRSTINGCIKTLDVLSQDLKFKDHLRKRLMIAKEDNINTISEKINFFCGQVPYQLGY